ncbi:MAG: tetratricopeptide repeat protein [Candidatus Omnitrophica bacterium]|nr:tetratricopeptide repeat protein [Candidatus Omnitrophota bacterium]
MAGEEKYMSGNSENTRINKARLWLSVALIVITGFAVYTNSLNNGFIWDDRNLIRDNAHLRSWSNIPDVFSKNIGEGAATKYAFYRPLQTFSYMLDYSLWGLDVRGYHLTNIVLHILVALSIFWLVNILYDNCLLSLLVSLFFVAHPIHTEAVTYISGRSDPLAAFFLISCLIFYIKCLYTGEAPFYVLMSLGYIFALLSREISLVFPLILLLYHYTFRKKVRIGQFLIILIIAISYIILRFTALRPILSNKAPVESSILQRIPGFFVALANYLRLLFLPLGLHMEYGKKVFLMAEPAAIVGLFIFIALITLVIKQRKGRGLVFFSISWFLVALLPNSNIYPLNAYMAEHWLYLPSIGFFLIFSFGLVSAYKKINLRMSAAVLAILLLALYGWLTVKQNTYWREPIAFYQRLLEFDPTAQRVYNEIGLTYWARKENEKAIPYLKKAIELKPDYYKAYNNLAIAYVRIGKNEEAIEYLEKAIEIEPKYAKAYNTLGTIYLRTQKFTQAISAYKKAIEFAPGLVEAYNNLGLAYQKTNKRKEAISWHEKAIELKPDYANAYRNLADAYASLGQNTQAIASYKRAIELEPTNGSVFNNLALVYFKQKQYRLAIQYCDKAKELGVINFNLLRALEKYRKKP